MASVDVTSAALASQEYILHVVENMNKSMLKKTGIPWNYRSLNPIMQWMVVDMCDVSKV